MVTLPLALEAPCGLAFRRSGTYDLDRIGSRTFHPNVAQYGGSRRLLEAFPATMDVSVSS